MPPISAAASSDITGSEVTLDKAARYPVEFTGSGAEYFRIWIVNWVLTILTLYIYSAWAKVRTQRYFYGNTVIDGSAFEYHARPLQILLGRMLAAVLVIAVYFGGHVHPLLSLVATGILLLILPWAIWKSTVFGARMCSFRNIRFDFTGHLWPFYLYLFVGPFAPLLIAALIFAGLYYYADSSTIVLSTVSGIAVIVFYVLAPFWYQRTAQYLYSHYRYGSLSFSATISTRHFYSIFARAFLLVLASLLVLGGLMLAFYMIDGGREFLMSLDSADADKQPVWLFVLLVVGVYALFLVGGVGVMAYVRSRLRNHVVNQIRVGRQIALHSSVGARSLTRLVLGNLFIMVLTLGLGYAWVQVRKARFFARHTAIEVDGSLDGITHAEQSHVAALGEEIGDAFDMDVGIAL